MTDLRDNLSWIVGSVLTAIAIAVGLFVESGIAVALISVLIGASVSYFVTTRTQRRVWKREYAVKVVEEVYGQLYDDMKKILVSLEDKSYYSAWSSVWRDIKDSYKYLMVDEAFRKEMDKLYDELSEYSSAVSQARGAIIPGIASEETERVFGVETSEHAQFRLRWEDPISRRSVSTTGDVIDSLLSQKPPTEWYFDRYWRQRVPSQLELTVEIANVDKEKYDSKDVDKFDAYWYSCLKRLRENPTVRFLWKENERLTIEVRKLMKELAKRIQEPWKI